MFQQDTLRQACSHKLLLKSVVFQTHSKASWKRSLSEGHPVQPTPPRGAIWNYGLVWGWPGNLLGWRSHISLLTCSTILRGRSFLNMPPKAHQYLRIIWSDLWNHTLPSWDFQHSSALEQVLSKNPSVEVTHQCDTSTALSAHTMQTKLPSKSTHT